MTTPTQTTRTSNQQEVLFQRQLMTGSMLRGFGKDVQDETDVTEEEDEDV